MSKSGLGILGPIQSGPGPVKLDMHLELFAALEQVLSKTHLVYINSILLYKSLQIPI